MVARTTRSWLTALGSLLVAFALLFVADRRADAQAFTVGQAVGRPIAPGFVGLSIELTDLERYAGTNPAAIDTPFVQLLANLAPDQGTVLRIGGDSSDWAWWPVAHTARPPGVRYDLTPTWMRVARATAIDAHARLILGINFEADNTRDAAAEGDAMVDRIGRASIDALEIGNEPELYAAYPWYRAANGTHVFGRSGDWDEAAFNSDFARIADLMPRVALAGPSSGSLDWLSGDLGTFLRSEPRVKLTTVHAYPLKHCSASTVVTPAELLANSSSVAFAQEIAPYVAVARRHGSPIRIDEMNAVSCGGYAGVSNTFASALWVLDALFDMARTGVDGVNIHTVPGTINEELGPHFARGRWTMRVHPEYYGMMMFAQAAPVGSRLLHLSLTPAPGLRVFATRATDGVVRVVLINDRLHGGQTVSVRVPSVGGPAVVEQLRSPSIRATTGITLGGQSFGDATRTGLLAGTPTSGELAATDGVYTVGLAPVSATLLTLTGTATG